MIDEKKLIEYLNKQYDYNKKTWEVFDESQAFNAMCAYSDIWAFIKGQSKIGEWIPCSERPPEDLTPVNITWTNRLPSSYYAHIKDVHFTNTGVFYKGKWFWWSVRVEGMLAEYDHDELNEIDDSIEVLAWQPLPEPWEGEVDE